MLGQMVSMPACSVTSVNVPLPLLWNRRLGILRSNRPPRLLGMIEIEEAVAIVIDPGGGEGRAPDA